LRILQLVHGFPPHTWAGTEVYTLELSSALRRRGHDVTVVARAPALAGEAEWNVSPDEFRGLRVLRVARSVEGLPIGESYKPRGARATFERILDDEQPDIVHVQHLLHLSVEWLDVLHERGLPHVLTYNDYWTLCARVQLQRTNGALCAENQGLGCLWCLKNKAPVLVPLARRVLPVFDPLVRRVLARLHPQRRLGELARDWIETAARPEEILVRCARADLGLAPSRFLRDKLLASGAFEPARLVHSDYGMRPPGELAPKLARAQGTTLRVAYMGSLVPYKGLELLVRAFVALRNEPIDLAIHGDYRPETDAFHARLRDLAQGSRVCFHGSFDNARLSEIYRSIDALVVPSTWYENSPLTIHEAFLHQTPVVASDIGGMRELVTHERDGLHFKTGDPGALAAVLRRLAREPGLLDRLARGVPRLKTLEEDAAQMEARYVALVEARPTPIIRPNSPRSHSRR